MSTKRRGVLGSSAGIKVSSENSHSSVFANFRCSWSLWTLGGLIVLFCAIAIQSSSVVEGDQPQRGLYDGDSGRRELQRMADSNVREKTLKAEPVDTLGDGVCYIKCHISITYGEPVTVKHF